MSVSLSPRPEVAILPSLPPSPSFLDEVFSHPRPWSVRTEDIDLQDLRRSSIGSAGSNYKRKGKQSIEVEDEDDEEGAEQGVNTHKAYPPITDEGAETRRVEETLKRWELAERQRRKAARESVQLTSGSSLFSTVTRTAGLVLSGRSSVGSSAGPGSTRTFKSYETVNVAREGYAVPLDDIDHSRASSRDITVHSPSASFERNRSSDAGMSENPFVHPSERTRTSTPTLAPTLSPLLTPVTPTPMLLPSSPSSPSPFGDAHTQRGDLATRVRAERKSHARKPSLGRFPPPVDAPHATQLQPTSQPVLRPPRRNDPKERQEVQWWHDWLCGCGEGPDRGGDNQAGRTNPFE